MATPTNQTAKIRKILKNLGNDDDDIEFLINSFSYHIGPENHAKLLDSRANYFVIINATTNTGKTYLTKHMMTKSLKNVNIWYFKGIPSIEDIGKDSQIPGAKYDILDDKGINKLTNFIYTREVKIRDLVTKYKNHNIDIKRIIDDNGIYPVTIILDDVQAVKPDIEYKLKKMLSALSRASRHINVTVYILTQTLNMVRKSTRSQVFSFIQSWPIDDNYWDYVTKTFFPILRPYKHIKLPKYAFLAKNSETSTYAILLPE